MPLDFRGRVVVVTGAGRGLGRRYALDLAGSGARVVVAVREGAAAERTVDDIRGAGGEAVAAVADARDGVVPVRTALSEFGRIDGLVVNAGHVRDRTFARMDDESWHDVVEVHLDGARAAAAAVWPVMRAQGSGRIVFTGSGAGLHGNRGQANYAAAKAGILGLSATLAVEGAGRDIGANVVLPMAVTDMTRSVFDDVQRARLSAGQVSAVVLALVHPSCPMTGRVVETGGGHVAVLRWERSAGVRLEGAAPDAADVAARWDDITRFDEHADHPTSIADCLAAAVGPVPGTEGEQ